MLRLWPAAVLAGIGIAFLVVASSAQSCVVWSDGSACETSGTIVFTVVGWIALAAAAAYAAFRLGNQP